MGFEYLGYIINAATTEAMYRPSLQPTYLQENLRLPAKKSRHRHNDDKGTGEVGIPRDGSEIYPFDNV